MTEILELLEKDVLRAAECVLGMHLVCGDLCARIVEVEAYRADDDPGSHAFNGKTPRNSVMFERPGLAYVYFTYGMHWLLNVVAHEEGRAAAVLIRAAVPITGLDEMRTRRPKASRDTDLLSGPAKLTAALGIDGEFNGSDLFDRRASLHLEMGAPVQNVLVGTRIGLQKGKGDELPWRFCDGDALKWISKPLPSGAY